MSMLSNKKGGVPAQASWRPGAAKSGERL